LAECGPQQISLLEYQCSLVDPAPEYVQKNAATADGPIASISRLQLRADWPIAASRLELIDCRVIRKGHFWGDWFPGQLFGQSRGLLGGKSASFVREGLQKIQLHPEPF